MPGGAMNREEHLADRPPDDPLPGPLDRVLDGTASADDRRAVEADPEAAGSVRRWGEIEAALRRTHAVPMAPELDELERNHRPIRIGGSWARWAAAAAGVLLAANVGVVLYSMTLGPSGYVANTERFAGNVFRAAAEDFTPTVVCDTPEKFVAYTEEYLSVGLTATFDTPVALIGWKPLDESYDDGPRVLLARDGVGRAVIVVFERNAGAPILPTDGYRVFTRRFGDVSATEITPGEASAVLDLVNPI